MMFYICHYSLLITSAVFKIPLIKIILYQRRYQPAMRFAFVSLFDSVGLARFKTECCGVHLIYFKSVM